MFGLLLNKNSQHDRLAHRTSRTEESSQYHPPSTIALVSLRSEKVGFPSAGKIYRPGQRHCATCCYPISTQLAAPLLARARCTVRRSGQRRINEPPRFISTKCPAGCGRKSLLALRPFLHSVVSCAQLSCGKRQTGQRGQKEHTLMRK